MPSSSSSSPLLNSNTGNGRRRQRDYPDPEARTRPKSRHGVRPPKTTASTHRYMDDSNFAYASRPGKPLDNSRISKSKVQAPGLKRNKTPTRMTVPALKKCKTKRAPSSSSSKPPNPLSMAVSLQAQASGRRPAPTTPPTYGREATTSSWSRTPESTKSKRTSNRLQQCDSLISSSAAAAAAAAKPRKQQPQEQPQEHHVDLCNSDDSTEGESIVPLPLPTEPQHHEDEMDVRTHASQLFDKSPPPSSSRTMAIVEQASNPHWMGSLQSAAALYHTKTTKPVSQAAKRIPSPFHPPSTQPSRASTTTKKESVQQATDEFLQVSKVSKAPSRATSTTNTDLAKPNKSSEFFRLSKANHEGKKRELKKPKVARKSRPSVDFHQVPTNSSTGSMNRNRNSNGGIASHQPIDVESDGENSPSTSCLPLDLQTMRIPRKRASLDDHKKTIAVDSSPKKQVPSATNSERLGMEEDKDDCFWKDAEGLDDFVPKFPVPPSSSKNDRKLAEHIEARCNVSPPTVPQKDNEHISDPEEASSSMPMKVLNYVRDGLNKSKFLLWCQKS
jgi:hypothetical protein